MTKHCYNPVWVPGLRIDPLHFLAGCCKRWLSSMASSEYWWWTRAKEGTFERGAPRGNLSAKTRLFGADRWTSHGSKRRNSQASKGSAWGNRKKQLLPNRLTEFWELEAPTAANRALGLMSIPGAAVTQKDRCHLVGHLRMPRARWSILGNPKALNGSAWGNRKKHHITVRDLPRFLTSSPRFS